MGFELDGIIKGVLYSKDGTVDYVFDDTKLDEIITPFENETDTERNPDRTLLLSSSKNFIYLEFFTGMTGETEIGLNMILR